MAVENDVLQILRKNNDLENFKNLNQHHNFEQIYEKIRNSSTSNKICVCSATPSIIPKHVRHMHSQNISFHVKFEKCTILPSAITSDATMLLQTGQ